MPELPATSSFKRLSQLLWPALALALLLLFNLLLTEHFFHVEIKDGHLYGTVIDILNRGAPVLLASLGMTLVIATAGVDLSVGSILAIAGAVAAVLLTESQFGVVLIVLVALGVSVLAGTCNGVLVSRFGVQPIVATLILMVAGRGIAQLLSEGQIITFENPQFSAIGSGHFLMLPIPVIIALTAYILVGALVRFTALGLFIESIGNNETASRYAGVNVRLIKTLVYALSGLCAGMAGVIVAADIKAADANNAGLYLELDAILAAVIGGTALTGGRFLLLGTIIGALLIQSLTTTILTRGVPVEYTLAVKAVVVLAVCLLQSAALREMIWRRRRAPA